MIKFAETDSRNDSECIRMKQVRRIIKFIAIPVMALILLVSSNVAVSAEGNTTGIEFGNAGEGPGYQFIINTTDKEGLSGSLQIIIVLTIIALAPSILIMMTSFTRIIIVLHFTRAALSTQTAPPNQVLVGIALFLTFYVMAPVFSSINTNAIQPFNEGTITQEQAFENGVRPLKEFMLANTDKKDLNTMLEIGGLEPLADPMEYSLSVVIPGFILSELRAAFIMGFLIYVPFIIIDMVVSSVLMSMGMMMLPPTTISLPFKILLFVLADGWSLVIVNMLKTINV